MECEAHSSASRSQAGAKPSLTTPRAFLAGWPGHIRLRAEGKRLSRRRFRGQGAHLATATASSQADSRLTPGSPSYLWHVPLGAVRHRSRWRGGRRTSRKPESSESVLRCFNLYMDSVPQCPSLPHPSFLMVPLGNGSHGPWLREMDSCVGQPLVTAAS